MLTRKKQKAPFPLSVVEICAGGGGQALGLEQAGFRTACAVEIEAEACATLQLNRPEWNIVQGDVRKFDGFDFRGADLLAGGVPCPPFSIAGKQLGSDDERDLFPEALRLVREMLEGSACAQSLLCVAFQSHPVGAAGAWAAV